MTAHVRVEDLALLETLEIVRSPARMAEIAPAWAALWRRADGLIFQSPDWIAAWWRTDPDQDRRALRIGLVWHGPRLMAVMPLATVWRNGFTVLEWAAKDHTDYADVLVDPECDPGAIGRLWQVVSVQGGFDLAYLNRLLPQAALTRLLDPAQSGGVQLAPNHRAEISYRVAGSWTTGAAWFDGQVKKQRQNHRRGWKMLEQVGTPRFRLLPPDEPLGPVLERLAELKRKWLVFHGRESNLFDEGSPALAALVEVLAAAGLLRVFVVECDKQMVAVSINFVQHGTMMAFVTTYDPDFERASPGKLLITEYAKWSFDNGLQMVDFLCGGEPFKRRFATASVPLGSYLGAASLLGAGAVLADTVRQAWHGARMHFAGSAKADAEADD